MTDADLVARAREGDDLAFGELVERHRGAVFRTALAVLGSAADADDVAQDACVLAHRRLGGFRAQSSFKTWLLTITFNQAINRRRGLLRLLRRLVSLDGAAAMLAPAGEFVSASQSPEQTTLAGERHRAVIDEVRRLSPKLRDTLVLAQSGDHTMEEIAAIMRVPVGTVKWRVAEARRLVRSRLRDRDLGRV